jgi:hypothetical protein
MKEIPSGFSCNGCVFLGADDDGWIDLYQCTLLIGAWGESGERISECLATYPNGATVTIVPKERAG